MALTAIFLSSCYSSRVINGEITVKEPLVEVNAKRNNFLFWGLLPIGETQNTQYAKNYIGEKENYATRTSWTFIDGVLNCITLGIYTPTTTTYYLPMNKEK